MRLLASKTGTVTFKKEFVWILVALVTGALLGASGRLVSTEKVEPATTIETGYKPGIARYVEYDYIRIDGVTYIIFRDKYTGCIGVVQKQ